MGSSLGRRRVTISEDNLGPVVSIVSILLLILVVLTVLTRLTTGYFLRRKLSLLEDGMVSLAAVFSVGELVTVLGMDGNGLGSHVLTLEAAQVDRFQQYSYAADVLYVINLGLTISSVLLLIHSLTPVKGQKLATLIVLGLTAMWTIGGAFALLFQCNTPHTWQFIDNRCIDRAAFWIFYTVAHVVTELSLIVLPIFLVWEVRVSKGKKSLVVLPFSLRILVVIPAIAQVVYFVSGNRSGDQTFDLWPAVFCAQITQAVGIMTACFIHLKPFFSSLNSGLLQNDEARRRRRQGSQNASGYLSLSHNSAKARSRNHRAVSDVQALTSESRDELHVGARDPWGHYEEDTVAPMVNRTTTSARRTPVDGRVIHHTTSIAVEYSKRDGGERQ